MKWLTFKVQHEPGFRFNLIDAGLLSVLALVSLVAYREFPFHYLFLLPLYVGLTFFLFCNVFRVGNRLEPFWYLAFVGVAVHGLFNLESLWFNVLVICEPIKLGLIAHAVLRPDYRGIFSGRIRRLGRGKHNRTN